MQPENPHEDEDPIPTGGAVATSVIMFIGLLEGLALGWWIWG